MRVSLLKDKLNVVLEGPACRMWFLGVRTLDSHLDARCRIPLGPPSDMFWVHTSDEDEMAIYRVGFPAEELFELRAKNYHGFLLRECLGALPLD